jgi:hypothetical protein
MRADVVDVEDPQLAQRGENRIVPNVICHHVP